MSQAMADPNGTSSSGLPPHLRPDPLPYAKHSKKPHKLSPIRSFSEVGSDRQDVEKEFSGHERRRSSRCLVCSAWMILVIFVLVLILLLLGFLFLSIRGSAMPNVYLSSLNFTKLNVNYNTDTSLNATVEIQMQVLNRNGNIELQCYGPLAIDISSENINLGATWVHGFIQNPKNMTVLNLNMNVTNAGVNEDDARALETNAESRKVVFDVVVHGNIGFHLGAVRVNWVPFQVICDDINQSSLNFAEKPKCRVQVLSSLPQLQKYFVIHYRQFIGKAV